MRKKIFLSLYFLFAYNILLLAQENISDFIYHDAILDVDYPVEFSKKEFGRFLNDINIESWSTFSWPEKNIYFKYPSYLTFKKEDYSENQKYCDSMVVFDYYSEKDSTSFFIFSLYLTRGDFNDAAFNAGFDTSTSIYNTYAYPPPIDERKPIWITTGRQGMRVEADSIMGMNWSGLVGRNSIGIDIGGMMGLGYKTTIFLMLKRSDDCSIVFECYYDSETACDFTECDFVKIVESFYKNYKQKKM